ncbi:NUDIX domain-containing protein [Kitasatospora sp. NPDC101155]|uniref:NUDIX domain-containing protein n=1 Tax=Kitasatospora sp. NPDC101155 TaxID=3364097 RepID=UPI0037F115E6
MKIQRGVYLIMVRDRKVLALRRLEDEDPLFKGVLDYPGGRMHAEEEPLDAARREGLEETGLQVERVEFLREWVHLWDDGSSFHVTTFIGWDPVGDVTLSDEHSEHHWLAPVEVLDQEIAEHQRESEIFRSWLDGFQEDTRLVERRIAAGDAG